MTPTRTSGTDPRYSRYLRTRQKGNWTVVFHELHPQPWHLPTSTWQKLHNSVGSLPPLIAGELRERGLLVTSPADDDAAWAAAHRELTTRLDRASILYLVLVQGCNFSCSYCPIPDLARQTGNQFMTPDTARVAIDLWARHVREDGEPGAEYCAILYGGEPLMNEPALTAAIEYIGQLQDSGGLPRDNLTIMVCTNGVLISQPIAQFFREHHVSVAVGCDGAAEDHDAIRRDTDGNATYPQVEAAIKTLVAEDVTTFASASITPQNLPRIGEFSTFFAELGVAKFGFNFLRGKLLFRLVPPERLAEYYEQATDGVVANYGNFGRRHLEYQLERKHMAMLERRYFPTDCNGYGNQLVIDPNGNIGHCPFLTADLASVNSASDGFRMNRQPVAQRWRSRLPLYNPACAPCDAKSICGGGCAWNTLELKDDPLAIDDAMCLLTRKVFEQLVWAGLPEGSTSHAS
jgi:uncharacterized protein